MSAQRRALTSLLPHPSHEEQPRDNRGEAAALEGDLVDLAGGGRWRGRRRGPPRTPAPALAPRARPPVAGEDPGGCVPPAGLGSPGEAGPETHRNHRRRGPRPAIRCQRAYGARGAGPRPPAPRAPLGDLQERDGGGRRVCHSRLGRAGSCGIVRACPDQASGKGSRAFGACPRPLGWGSPGRTCGAELNRVVRSRSMLDPG